MIRQYSRGRWEGTDRRLATTLDEIIGNGGCDNETGDVSMGGSWYGLVRRSGGKRGGFIVETTAQGFMAADSYDRTEDLDAAWASLTAEIEAEDIDA